MNVKSFAVLFFLALIMGALFSSVLIVFDPFGEEKQVKSAIAFPTPTVSKFNSENSNQSKQPETAKSQEEKSDSSSATTAPLSEKEIQAIREKFRSGAQLTPDEIAKLRQQFQGAGGSGGRGGMGGASRGFSGSSIEGEILEIKDNFITIKSADSSTEISISEDTTIRFSSLISLKDLKIDTNIQIVGERSEDGQTSATFIRILEQNPNNFRRGGMGRNSSQPGNFLSGKITEIDKSKITIETTRGPLSVNVNPATAILNTSSIAVADLSAGLKITGFGTKNDQQILEARLINASTEEASKALEKFAPQTWSLQ